MQPEGQNFCLNKAKIYSQLNKIFYCPYTFIFLIQFATSKSPPLSVINTPSARCTIGGNLHHILLIFGTHAINLCLSDCGLRFPVSKNRHFIAF